MPAISRHDSNRIGQDEVGTQMEENAENDTKRNVFQRLWVKSGLNIDILKLMVKYAYQFQHYSLRTNVLKGELSLQLLLWLRKSN